MRRKSLLIGILIGSITLPTLAIGGSFTMSLIQGKSPTEAIQILSEQMDFLMGKVATIETKQIGQEQKIQELTESVFQPSAVSSTANNSSSNEAAVSDSPPIRSSSAKETFRSRGVITIYNELDQPMKLIKSSRFVTNDNLLFRSVADVTVPSRSDTTALIESDEYGSSYLLKCSNEQPCVFRLPALMNPNAEPEHDAYLHVYAKSFSNFEPIK